MRSFAIALGLVVFAAASGPGELRREGEILHMLRKRSQLVVAFGSCAHLGGIPRLANFTNKAEIFANSYFDVPSVDNPGHVVPLESWGANGEILTLPKFFDTVHALDQVIPVDYYLPGCAPPQELIMNAVTAILTGQLPPKGTVLSPSKAACDVCPRKDSKPDKIEIAEIKRITTSIPDLEECFLAQGYVCMGPATRSGCGERCIHGNMPCRGCFGPPDDVYDQGAKFLSFCFQRSRASTAVTSRRRRHTCGW